MKRALCLSVMLLAGCAVEHPQELLTSEAHEPSYAVQQGYQVVCRAILHGAQAEFGESSIMHELWPDLQEGMVYRVSPSLRGADFIIQVRADGAGSCQVTIAGGLNQFQRQRVTQCVETSLARLRTEQ